MSSTPSTIQMDAETFERSVFLQQVGEASLHDAATVLANTPFLLTRCSSDLRYLFVSEACAKMIGHDPEEVVGKKSSTL
jgi:PAS domain-containing protein